MTAPLDNGGAVNDGGTGIPMPARLRKLGYANLVVGPLVALVNILIVGKSISRLVNLGASNGIIIPLAFITLVFCVLGAVLFFGGMGLIKERRWGRTWSLVFAFGSFGAAFLVGITAKVLTAMSETGAVTIPGLHHQENFNAGIGIFSLYAILVIVLLMLADARAWASGRTQTAQAAIQTDPLDQASTAPASGLAIGSLVASLIPFLLLGQITGLILGIIALRRIKESNGTIGGRGFAIAGVTISSVILLFIIGILVLLIVTGAFHK